jgi:hypothetical protein
MQGLMFGPSMKPTMSGVGWVWMEPFEYLCVGDIVCFKREHKLGKLIHRIIDIDALGIVYIKGDNAPEVDCVSLSNIYFKVTKHKNLFSTNKNDLTNPNSLGFSSNNIKVVSKGGE